MSSSHEVQVLFHSEFWDQRYAKAAAADGDDNNKPTHEWYQDFEKLEPFFAKHLLGPRKAGDGPRILRLGSGDSVN
ncbi:hypothetical protein K504DRAFT_156913 [Pleomassaria siparia CBS 279.74]|uniref:Uncharacterized protein n=1 Tax=Pleomassaria siparia CBS 279.74 TaxID=1314801 RepID=A0A6G1KPH2_9PLEO|nr:hypothetical protein K504DRAFT_156913 [Pleomassaria siparia CBS 279.74]